MRAVLMTVAFMVIASSAPDADARRRDPTARLEPTKDKKKKSKKKKKRARAKAKVAKSSDEPALLGEPVPPPPAPIVATAVAVELEDSEAEESDEESGELIAAADLPARDRNAPRIELGVDAGPVMRRLRYRDDWMRDGETVRDYDLTANAIAINVVARPLAGIELVASGELLVRVAGSAGPDSEVHDTSSSEFQLGARFVGDIGRAHAGLDVAIGQHAFEISDEMSAFGELVPDTTYRFVRAGAGVTVPVTPAVRLTSALGYRHLIGTGDLASTQWFPQAKGGGADVAVGLEVQLTSSLHAHLRGQVRRYFFSLNPEVGDALIVGGALDQYVSLAAGLSLSVR